MRLTGTPGGGAGAFLPTLSSRPRPCSPWSSWLPAHVPASRSSSGLCVLSPSHSPLGLSLVGQDLALHEQLRCCDIPTDWAAYLQGHLAHGCGGQKFRVGWPALPTGASQGGSSEGLSGSLLTRAPVPFSGPHWVTSPHPPTGGEMSTWGLGCRHPLSAQGLPPPLPLPRCLLFSSMPPAQRQRW